MKIIVRNATICLVLGAVIAVNAQTLEFHVSTSGNDAANGTREKPFATLERARDAVRATRAEKKASGPATIWLAAGTYR